MEDTATLPKEAVHTMAVLLLEVTTFHKEATVVTAVHPMQLLLQWVDILLQHRDNRSMAHRSHPWAYHRAIRYVCDNFEILNGCYTSTLLARNRFLFYFFMSFLFGLGFLTHHSLLFIFNRCLPV